MRALIHNNLAKTGTPVLNMLCPALATKTKRTESDAWFAFLYVLKK